MSEQPVTGHIPEWTLGWRLQRALDYAGMSVEDIAVKLEVGRSTISRWMHDQGARPRAPYITTWACATGVDPGWLASGMGGPGKAQGGRTAIKPGRSPQLGTMAA